MDAILEYPNLTRSQEKMVEILLLLKDIPKSKDKKEIKNQTLQICKN